MLIFAQVAIRSSPVNKSLLILQGVLKNFNDALQKNKFLAYDILKGNGIAYAVAF